MKRRLLLFEGLFEDMVIRDFFTVLVTLDSVLKQRFWIILSR